MLKKIPSILKNKYFITVLVFVVWVFFFDTNNFFSQRRLTKELNEVKVEKQFYIEEIEKDKEAKDELLNNSEYLEKFARENYLMKRENEDIFIVIDEEEK